MDVSSPLLDAALGRTGAPRRFANTPEGHAELAAFCQHHQVELVAMEATGGYERQGFPLLSGQGLPLAILNPRAVRQIDALAGDIAALIANAPLWAVLDHSLRAFKGVAGRTVARLMAEMPEIGTLCK